jgi:hypothetical protein
MYRSSTCCRESHKRINTLATQVAIRDYGVAAKHDCLSSSRTRVQIPLVPQEMTTMTQKQHMVGIDHDLYEMAKHIAKWNGISLNRYINDLLEKSINMDIETGTPKEA